MVDETKVKNATPKAISHSNIAQNIAWNVVVSQKVEVMLLFVN